MLDRRRLSCAGSRALVALGASLGLLLVAGSAVAQAQQAHVLIYSGTVAHRHTDAINQGIGPIQDALDDADITYDWENCGEIAAIPGCHEANQNDRIFTDENLAQYDALFFFNAGGNTPQPLWNQDHRNAIQGFVNDGGGIAANHLATDIGAGQVSWGWWDGLGNSALGTTMPAHPAAPQTATLQVSDRSHSSTRDLPDEIEHTDEHYSFDRNVRGTHHVLATLDETSYDPLAQPHGGGNPPAVAMGADHPISWCRAYDGGRIWATSMGHFGNLYTANGGDNYLIDHLLGGVRWAAGVEGTESDCGGTVWSNFSRTVLSTDVQGPIGLDIAEDGRVYWTEIGQQGLQSSGRLKMWDPETGDTELVATIETRADALSTSEDGVLGMELDPDFVSNGYVYIYYSPRGEGEDWPTSGTGIALGHNRLSRFELDAAGTAVVSEQPILDVPKVKVGPDGDGRTDTTQQFSNWPAHTGGAGVDFDSEGNLYLGVGDDVNPMVSDGYSPIDQRFEHRYDARNTSANTNDLRGKVLRITPKPDASGEPGEGSTYEVPEGNMFAPGTEGTRPEIYAMGFRQPFTVQADPAEPGTIVVGEYGPDNAGDNANRGPAGIIEWNHITEPGFFGFPLCVGDNSNFNSYNRWEFPSGPSGDRFDCSAEEIPNESPNNTGLDAIPGPAEPAELWHKRNGQHPPEFGLPTQGQPQEAITGPIYRHDPDNPSETKWPAYFDGSWLVLDRGQNWWREARITDDGGGLLRVNGFFQPNQFGTPSHTSVIPVKFGPDGSLYLARFTGRGSSAQLMRIDYIGDQEDEDPPEVTASVSGNQTGEGDYINRATLRLEATDGPLGSGVAYIEYSVDGGDWVRRDNDGFAEPFATTVPFEDEGDYEVAYRAADRNGNPSEEGVATFTVVDIPGCEEARSDEFDGGVLDEGKWTVRIDDPSFEAEVADGALVLPVLDEIDGTETGPFSFVSQQVPDGDWAVTTRVTIEHETNWQQAGLTLWQSDGNFIKVGFTADSGSPDDRRFEITSDDPVDQRHFSADSNVDASFPTTAWIRMLRDGNLIGGEFAPDEGGQPGEWTTLAGTRNVSGVDPGSGIDIDPPREGEGVMVGPYAGGHIDGPWTNTAAFDFVRFDPDELVCDEDVVPPVTSAQLNGADPEPSYDEPVDVELSATDGTDENATGVDYTEYRIDSDDPGDWVRSDNDGDDPFVTELQVTGEGDHEVEYRSADNAGNVEETRSVAFEISGDQGEPELRITTAPRQHTVGPKRKKVPFRVRARNIGDAPSGSVQLCAAGPAKRVRILGPRCVTRQEMAPGSRTVRRVMVRLKPAARGKLSRIRLIGRGPGIERTVTTAGIRVRK